ncbi:PITH domain-containing protein [Cerioporus squamosus]|nr:PITH domain-containing protein [Cerioporus squamosus]
MADTEISLLEHLDTPQVTCLNESPEHTFKAIVEGRKKNTGDAYVLSEADEQLLINISFNQTVKIRSISIQSKNVEQGPKTIRLYINRPSLTFSDVEDGGECLQEIELTEEDVAEGKKIPLRFVRFQSVTSLHIFVVSNLGGEDETRIDAIDIFGLPVMGTRDVSGLKKVEDE